MKNTTTMNIISFVLTNFALICMTTTTHGFVGNSKIVTTTSRHQFASMTKPSPYDVAFSSSRLCMTDGQKQQDEDDNNKENERKILVSTEQLPLSRRKALGSIAKASLGVAAAITLSPPPKVANALEKTFPEELTDLDPKQVEISKTARLNSQQRATKAQQDAQKRQTLYTYNIKDDGLPSLLWGGALWFLSGSRSNPLTTPLANVLYDESKEEWLRDRNAGLFASPPIELLGLLGVIFVFFGIATEFVLLQLTGGDVNISLQLAGVTVLNGLFWELGRLASGEKQDTREENDRAVQLQTEFQEFANNRLQPGGNCHRNDVVRAFRRYFAKYREQDSEEYPLTDLEIEKLLRSWNKIDNMGKADMTSSGFYYGIQINQDADVFV